MAADAKAKQADSLRTPKPKKKLGLSVPPALRLPHEDLILPSETTKDTSINPSTTSQTSRTSLTSLTSHTSEAPPPIAQQLPVAPERDYAKVANSITRHAIPAGVFTGKGKQLYDCLYALTRGAITPSRSVRISRPKLMKKAGIGSRITFDTNIERLLSVGLISVKQIPGEHDGNEYTVFLPEETTTTLTSQTSLTSLTSSAQKLDRLVRLETSQTRHTSSDEESMIYENPKTSSKTIDDDEYTHTARSIFEPLAEAARMCVGSGKLNLSNQEQERWRELGELLADELRAAAGRTVAISSAPALLAAHLRRRLLTAQSLHAHADTPNRNTYVEGDEVKNAKQEEGKNQSKKSDSASKVSPQGESKFSLQECRQFADHLHKTGQGINNPGGYAMTIHRTGEADELIEAFLQPAPPKSLPEDASLCPDCKGTGYWYPGGIDKGVAICKHEKLRAAEGT
jgi:hypothetical protein